MIAKDINRNSKIVKPEWIGQGYGYKSDKPWKLMKNVDVVYIPEYGFDSDENISELYTKSDFIDLANGNEKFAETIFDNVDWQFPETWLDEYENGRHCWLYS